MKKKFLRKSVGRHVAQPNINLRVLCKALMAAGLISSFPAFSGSLPTPCAGVPCGSNTGNLPFVQAGTFKTPLPTTSGTVMTINQTSPNAILNWQDFNIASGYTVNFKQPSNLSSTLNRIWDASPTTISGSLTANGQIYLINQNGIVFANGAQVNTGTLIASSLDITDTLYQAGYLTNTRVSPSFIGTGGFIKVDTGATLNGSTVMLFAPVVENSGSISTADGQVVMAAGHNVYLEASQDPNLRGVLVEVDVNSAGVADPKLAAQNLLHTEKGTVTNAGDIIAQRGNVSLVGFAVNQQGRVSATTSVTENGSIKLLARYNVAPQLEVSNSAQQTIFDVRAKQTGKVTLASGSVTQVVPELTDTSTTTDGQGFNPSIVEAMGKTIEMQTGSSIVSPGGKVTLAAMGSIDPTVPATGDTNVYQSISNANTYSSFLNPNYIPLADNSGARVFLDTGSSIDVSGSTASVSVARDVLSVQLRGSQLQNDPLQLNGFLWGKNVNVDIRQGSTLVNYSGEESQIGRTVAERTATGGSVSLVSTGDVVVKHGVQINLSGGQVDYTGAYLTTTSLISNGVGYSIASASPNLIYDGIVTGGTTTMGNNKWGVSQTFNSLGSGSQWDPGYVQGMSAGTLTVLAPQSAIDGNIAASTVTGAYQRQPYANPATLVTNNYQNTWKMLAQGGGLFIGETSPLLINNATNYITNSDVVVQSAASQLPSSFAVDSVLPNNLITLDSNLFDPSTGLSRFGVYSNQSISINANTPLNIVSGGSLTLQANSIYLLSDIYASSGTLTFGTSTTAGTAGPTLAGNIDIGTTGSPVKIITTGQWVNDYQQSGASTVLQPEFINGGNISIKSGADLNIEPGTLVDASAGAWMDSAGKAHGGNGGSISLGNGTPVDSTHPYTGNLAGLDLRSYGSVTGKGGSLTIKAGDITLSGVDEGGTASSDIDPNAENISSASTSSNGMLTLAPDFFQLGGFSSYSLNAQGYLGMNVASNALITPQSITRILNSNVSTVASTSTLNSFTTLAYLPDWQRSPTNIALSQSSILGGLLKVGTGAIIQVEPTSSITLTAANQLTVLGTLDAPAGSINLNLASTSTVYNANQSIWLGANSQLLSSGSSVLQPNTQNLREGQVLSGGTISINNSTNGLVVAEPGSLMDVSGISTTLDIPYSAAGVVGYQPTQIAGNAGSISISIAGGALLDGTLNAGVSTGSTASAGSFTLNLQINPHLLAQDPNNIAFPQNTRQLMVDASGKGSFITSNVGTAATNDNNAGTVSLTAAEGKAYVDASALKQAGFDQIALKSFNSINLADQSSLQAAHSLTLDAPSLLVGGSASVSSSYINVGNSNPQNQTKVNPQAGNGSLTMTGQLIDLTGNFTISGVNQVSFTSLGDIRLNGVLKTSTSTFSGALLSPDSNYYALQGSLVTQGNIGFQANQIYPSTMSQFALNVQDGTGASAGNITISGGSNGSSPVLSAGGQLTVNAANIVQDGVVKAPMGSINLNGSQSVNLGSGSLTSVSAEGQTIPFGFIQSGSSWVYDLTGAGQYVQITTPPAKQVDLLGPNVAVNSGATIDLTGGGDLYAYEFIPGPPTSANNMLSPAYAPANTFAILPGVSGLTGKTSLTTGFAPYDPQFWGQYQIPGTSATNPSKTTLKVGESVYLSGGAGISAGYYTLLPASYALLPGGYTVTLTSGTTYQDMLPGASINQLSGAQIMAGKFSVAGTTLQDSRWSGFIVTPGSVASAASQFNNYTANTFFSAQAVANGTVTPSLPVDAGQLVISAQGANADLVLNGKFNTQPGAGGEGALVDLNVSGVGSGFDIVNTIGPANGLVQLDANALNALDVQSLLIGGVRSFTSGGMSIAVGADTVQVDNSGSTLHAPEIMLAANTAVTVKAGSSIQGSGTFTGQASTISIVNANGNNNGALLRVSTGPQLTVTRKNADLSSGALTLENGTSLGATNNALLLDSSSSTAIGDVTQSGLAPVLNGNSLSVAAQNISVGNSSASTTSLVLNDSLLTEVQAFKNLTLHSYGDINFYGAASLGGLDANGQHILSNLVLNGRSLNGLNNSGLTNNIDASNVTLLNNNSGTSAAAAFSAGNLAVNSDQITLAGGNISIQGFDSVNLNAAKQILAQGTSNVVVTAGDANVHNLVLQAGQIAGTNTSNLTIAAANDNITILSVAGATPTAPIALNAKLTITGKNIVDNGVINLPTGTITLHATGSAATDSVTVDSGSSTAATGISETISGQTVYALAGSVTLTSDNGGVSIQSGAVVDVSGVAGGGDAGSINISATNGSTVVAGDLRGSANAKNGQGSFTLDTHTLSLTSNSQTGNALTDLNNALTSGSFTTLRDMRIRSGDLVLAADVPGTVRAKAQTFNLTADAGTIDVSGSIDSSGTNGGSILLAANGNLTLHTGALLDAHSTGTGKSGGSVTLETTVGAIDLANQLIDVHGSGNTGGSILLRAPQINSYSDVALYNTGGTSLNVSNNANVTVEAFRVYTVPTSLIVSPDINYSCTSVYCTDATTFADNYAATIKARLGMNTTNMSNMHLTPGVELDSSGNITLASNWDLSNWRFNDGTGDGLTEAGILTIRAGGNLTFGSGTTTASLTDGFNSGGNPIIDQNGVFGYNDPTYGFTPIYRNTDQINYLAQADWSYRLVAGADFSGANTTAVKKSTTGNIVLNSGSESNAAGGNLGYTGTPTFNMEQIRTGNGFIDISAGGNLTLGNRDSVIYTAGTAADGNNPNYFPVAPSYYGAQSGNLTINVIGNINGAVSNQLVTDWQWRDPNAWGVQVPGWWINTGSFRQGVGALGGGNVNVTASGNINNLEVSTPTSGYIDTTNSANPVAVVLGGGNLNVTAGGNINSGVFYVGNGQGTIRAGGNLGTGTVSNQPATMLAMDYGNFDVRTGGDLILSSVFNPTVLPVGFSQVANGVSNSNFFTYGDATGVTLTSLSGNVTTGASTNFFMSSTASTTGFFYLDNYNNQAINAASVYPGSLQVSALDGSIISTGFKMFPSTQGELNLVAAQNIQLNGQLVMSDAAPSGLQPTTPTPASGFGSLWSYIQSNHSLVHASDAQPVILSAGENITGNSNMSSTFILPKSAQIEAGQDVQYVNFNVQNLNSQDTTSIVAGRDISTITASVAGPGQVVLQAGRNVDLGQYNGVTTTGNLTNFLLPQQGANITVLAGVGSGGVATQSFIDKYINPANVTAYINKFLDPNTGFWTSVNINNYLNPNTPTGLAMMPALIPYVASKGVSAANAFNVYTALPTGKQAGFIAGLNSNSGNADLISFVGNNGASKGLTTAQALAYFKTMSMEKQSLFVTSEQALGNFKGLPLVDQVSFITGGADSALISFVANNGGPQGQSVTATQALNYFKSMPLDKQSQFITGGADLIAYVNAQGGAQVSNWADAYTAFISLPDSLKNAFVDQVLYAQLEQAGRNAISSGNYSEGYDALATLFPSGEYSGDINLYYSQIKTMRGGNINLLIPGGGVNAGLANPSANGSKKTAAQLGIVTVSGGDVNAMVSNDFMVNQSRVFTLQGGNILMWSSAGNIDAGKGSKTVSSTPPPLLVVDPTTGTFNIDVTQSVVGSGIRVLLANKNVVPGSVDLYAPTGAINAGDAGIGAAGNIFLGAQQVIGANNINFGGTGAGVPVTAVAPVSVSGMGNVQDASKAADQATQSLNNSNELSKLQEALANFKPTFISVDVIGLGDEAIGSQQQQ